MPTVTDIYVNAMMTDIRPLGPQPVDPKGDDAKKYMKDEIYPKCVL